MVIYVMRHGQTDWNVAKRLQGRSDTVLNENGRELGKRFWRFPLPQFFPAL